MRPVAPVAVLAALALAPAASATVLPPAVIDTAPLQIKDIAVAPDGTGALVYLKTVGADDRVFLSLLAADGTWGAPQVADTDAGDDEAAARVAVGNGGRVLVGYRDGAALHYRLITATGGALSAEGNIRVAANATAIGDDWDLDMNAAGVAYAAWKEFNPGVMHNDVRAWRLEGTTATGLLGGLQKDPATTAVDATANGPDVRVGVDPAGNGGISFTQNDAQAWFRRLVGTTPSGTFVDTLLPDALGEAISGTYHQHDLDIGKDGVAWESANAMYPNGGHVVGVPVSGDTAGTKVLFDLHPKEENDNAERPDVALNETGRGLFAAEANQKAGVWGGSLDGATASAPQRLDLSPTEPAGAEIPVAAIGDSGRGLVAFTRDVADGAAGPVEVRARVFDGAFAPTELLLSDPALGQGSIPFGIGDADGAGASRLGDGAVLMQQVQGGVTSVVVGRYDAPPSAPVGTTSETPGSLPRPLLKWTAAEAQWSPLASYKVLVDDAVIGTVGAGEASFTPPADIAPGAHTWRVVAVDGLGQETSSAARGLRVDPGDPPPPPPPPPPSDTTKPKLALKVTGKRRVRRTLKIRARASDAGGIAKLALRVGSGKPRTRAATQVVVRKAFRRRGKVRLRVSATDRAGNVARLSKTIRIRRGTGRGRP